MTLNTEKEITVLQRMTVPGLRRKYAEVFGETTTARHKQFLIRRIVWRVQANQEGDLSDRARRRARELAADSDVRLTAPREKTPAPDAETRTATIQLSQDSRLPTPGAIITRPYKGEIIEVRVLPQGFEHEGEVYRTLSAVARKVTGTHWNGYHFFKLGRKGRAHGQRDD